MMTYGQVRLMMAPLETHGQKEKCNENGSISLATA